MNAVLCIPRLSVILIKRDFLATGNLHYPILVCGKLNSLWMCSKVLLMPAHSHYCRLSAWIIRVLKYTNFPEWQFIIWIDPYVIKKTLQWLLTYQAVEGYFTETSDYIKNPFDARFVNEVILSKSFSIL